MISRMFGDSDQEQFSFLAWRSIVTLIVTVLAVLCGVLPVFGNVKHGSSSGIIPLLFACVMLFVWGWPVLKRMFGFATIGSLLSGNIIVGLFILICYIILAYIVGIIVAVFGVLRFLCKR